MSSEPLPFRHLAVDGPIGVGKTTLVEMLVKRFEAVKVLEDVSNPFLEGFYDDRPGSAFQTELYFLLTRFKQQRDIVQQTLFDKLVVSDYTFPKNRIFAYLNLSDDELLLFDKLYTLLATGADARPGHPFDRRRRQTACSGSRSGRGRSRRACPKSTWGIDRRVQPLLPLLQSLPLLVVITRHLQHPGPP